MTLKKENRESGLTLVEVIVVVGLCCIGMACWLSVPHHRGADPRPVNCVNNLKELGLVMQRWSLDHNDFYPMNYKSEGFDGTRLANDRQMFVYFQILSNDLAHPKILICPDDGIPTTATNFQADFNSTRVSFFAGLDARKELPHTFLAGDTSLENGRNMGHGLMEFTTNSPPTWTKKRHDGRANILFTDGSVQRLGSKGLQEALQQTGLITNRLVLPANRP